MEKPELRTRFCSLRESLAPDRVASVSTTLCQRLAIWPPLQEAKTVLSYLAFRNELDPSPLFALLPGKRDR